MKHYSKIILSTIGILALIGMSTNAMAFGGDKAERHVEKMKERLGLTNQQADQIKTILKTKQHSKKNHRDGHKEIHRAIMKLDPSSPDYEKNVNKLAEEKAQMVAKKIKEGAQIRKQIHAILTPEQREKAKTMHKERMDCVKKHHNPDH